MSKSSGPIRTVVVTGAASGVGLQTVQELLAGGDVRCELVDVITNPPSLAELSGVPVELWRYWECDVSDRGAVAALCQEVSSDDLVVTGLVNAAGNHRTRPTIDVSRDDFLEIFEVHCLGSLYFAQGLYGAMRKAGGGSIVNVSSVGARIGLPGRAAYGASKASIESLTRTLAAEWAAYGIRVNAVSLGYLDTPMGMEGVTDVNAIGSRHALGRIGTAAEASGAIRFLLSDTASFVTGAVWLIDGGFTIFRDT